jgi:PHD/YefM family antitoxin component YafN of YafNO toxin-antitoxin module
MAESTAPPLAVSATTVRQEWSSIVERITQQHARILVEEDGTAVAAIVSVADLQHLSLLDEQRARFLAAMDRTQAAFADVPDDELAEEIEKALAAARAASSGPTSR